MTRRPDAIGILYTLACAFTLAGIILASAP